MNPQPPYMFDVWRIVNAVVQIKFRSPELTVLQIIAGALGPYSYDLSDSQLADRLERLTNGDQDHDD